MLQRVRAWWIEQKKRGQELEERRRQAAETVRDAQASAGIARWGSAVGQLENAERRQFEPDEHEENE